jgi:hypothetical protein
MAARRRETSAAANARRASTGTAYEWATLPVVWPKSVI